MRLAELAIRGALFKTFDLASAYVDPAANIDGVDPATLTPAPAGCRCFVDVLQPAIKCQEIANSLVG